MGFSFTTSTKEVLEQFVREPRFRALTNIPTFAPMEIGLIVAAFVVFTLGSTLYLDDTISWLTMTALNIIAIAAMKTKTLTSPLSQAEVGKYHSHWLV